MHRDDTRPAARRGGGPAGRPVTSPTAGRAGAPAAGAGLAHTLTALQRTAGNAAVSRMLERRAPAGAPGGSRPAAPRSPQDDLLHDPRTFLSHSALALDFALGMRNRMPELPLNREAFVRRMGDWNRHWFVLVPDARRTREGMPAYLLAPAVEKYVEAFGDDPLLAPLAGDPRLAPVRADQDYLASSYVPYLTGSTANPEESVGHARVPGDAGRRGSGSEFVFTATMNGCAFAVEGAADDGGFTAWHYQSPSSATNRGPAREFRGDRSPTDWFGVEEYETPGDKSLFEAANMLWRGPEGWEVVSQEVRVDLSDMNKARIAAVRSRPLHLAPGHEAAYTARIYAGFATSQLDRYRRLLEQARKSAGPAAQREALEKNVFKPLEMAMASDALMLGGAATFPDLAGIAQGVKARRVETVGRVLAWVGRELEGRTARRGGLLNPGGGEAALQQRRERIKALVDDFSDTFWADDLIEEANARATAPGERPAGPGERG
ncbi:hypothetical protein [Streptomyces sp. A1499]|uniref:hypothetical protein n=1 Tax=Streptomyces sp. A1499 TaxID=2563104 RepID=UPI00109E663F|nr:hypothetical protein [Streptomyces sp. A1499]THC41564.1 hypothetical protein E7X58_36905 [Streptomyces sp. A1499]